MPGCASRLAHNPRVHQPACKQNSHAHGPSPSPPPGPLAATLVGAATFVFQNPAIFEASSELGDITGLYMIDDEGTIQVGVGVPGRPARSQMLRCMLGLKGRDFN